MDRTGGVLSFNNDIRTYHLQQNIYKYAQYDQELDPESAEVYKVYTRPLDSLTNGKTLIDFTHDGQSEYSARINHNYMNDNYDAFRVYENNKPLFGNRWSGDFYNYLNYVMAVYGHEIVPIQFINGILSLNFMDKAIELLEPGIVRDISPVASIAGVVKTNINNFSGTDTRLGLITNQMYAKSLLIGATFNSDRQRTASYKYGQITPSLLGKYGNTEANVNNLPNLISPVHNDGRIVEDYNQDVYIFDEYGDIKNLNTVRISEALKKNINQPFVAYNGSYQNTMSGTYYNSLDKSGHYANYTDTTINTERGKYVNVTDVNTEEFENSDKRLPCDDDIRLYDGEMLHLAYEDEGERLIRDVESEFDAFKPATEKVEGSTQIDKKSLLYKTNEIFSQHKIHTIYGEHPVEFPFGFGDFGSKDTETTTTDTAKTGSGRSRGRNLLKRDGKTSNINGYDNPFCRTWTYHNQYDKVHKLIRPFTDEEGNIMSLRDVQKLNANYRSFVKKGNMTNEELNQNGGDYLASNTVLRDTGYVNIAPSSTSSKEANRVDIKKCMFSIENLAWKDVPDRVENLSKEQRGPHGGRIMWFPPYDIKFKENVNASWEGNSFIGRGEKIYTYTNTERTGTLSFTLLIDHPSILNDLHNEAGQENYPDYDDNDRPDTSDMEGDILRFFAGCRPLKYKKKIEEPEREPERDPDPEPEPITKEICIYVFYPNDYSGHMDTIIKASKKQTYDKTGDADLDFASYLIRGTNVSVGDDFVGYEMRENGSTSGISDVSSSDFIPACSIVKPYTPCSKEYNNKKDKYSDKRKFRYRVDFDLRQNGLFIDENTNNYNDTKSFALNLDIEQVKNENYGNKKDATYSFAEFFYAIENLKKTVTSGSGDYDEVGMSYVKKRLEEINQDSASTRLDEICAIFTPDRVFDSIEIKGGATIQDKTNSMRLANRRASSLKWYIKNAYKNRPKASKEGEEEDVFDVKVLNAEVAQTPSSSSKDINGFLPKRARYAVIKIKYTTSETEKLSKTDANLSQTKDTEKHFEAMHILYEKMLEKSEILTFYTDSGIASEETFRTWFDESEYSQLGAFKDEYIKKNIDDLTEIDDFYSIIYDYCEYMYKKQNIQEVSGYTRVGYSKTVDLGSNIALQKYEINQDFENTLARVFDLSKIEKIIDLIEEKNHTLEAIGEDIENKKNEFEQKNRQIDQAIKALKDFTPGTSGYTGQIEFIQMLIDEKKTTLRELGELLSYTKETTKIRDQHIKELEFAILAENKDERKTIEKLNKEIESIDKKVSKLQKEIGKIDIKVEELDQKLNIYLTEASRGNKNNNGKISYNENQIIKYQNEKAKKESEIDTLDKQKAEKVKRKTDIEFQSAQALDALRIPSFGNTMHVLNTILSSEKEYNKIYDEVFPQSSSTVETEVYKNPYFTFNGSIHFFRSGFLNEETIYPKKEIPIRFWMMYTIYLLTRWVESDICGIKSDVKSGGRKTGDDLSVLFKNAIDGIAKSDNRLQYLMTLLATRARILNEPKAKFTTAAVPSYLVDTNLILEGSGSGLEKTFEFIHTDLPTIELSNEAISEINAVLDKEAKAIKGVYANPGEESTNTGNTVITENNEESDSNINIEDSAANTVLRLETPDYKTKGHRYETEAEYFSKLEHDSPLIFKRIKDKIKYFDPAFHSMSPEGFNARLTFLHQCTRQGNTIELQTSRDIMGRTAGNLAFGRMPVCILRIGDFIYSRIIITSVSIDYADMQWDLNPEGAGVQPMMAKVSMAITIIGGQSLEGPISKLQNAISFNYYANTGVYDDRADRAKPEGVSGGDTVSKDALSTATVEKNEANQRKTKSDKTKISDKYSTNYYYNWKPISENDRK